MVQIQVLCIFLSLQDLLCRFIFLFSSNPLLSRTLSLPQLTLSQSLAISHVLLLHCFSHNHLSTTTAPTKSSGVTSPCAIRKQIEEEKFWCGKIYGLSLTAEEAETQMDSPHLQRREDKKTQQWRHGETVSLSLSPIIGFVFLTDLGRISSVVTERHLRLCVVQQWCKSRWFFGGSWTVAEALSRWRWWLKLSEGGDGG